MPFRRRSNWWIKLWVLLAALVHKYIMNPNATWLSRLVAFVVTVLIAALLVRTC